MTFNTTAKQCSTLLVTLASVALLSACSGSRPMDIGVTDNALAPCPSSPNCVSSFADSNDEDHYIKPLTIADANQQATWARLQKAISNNDSATIITEEDNYIYAEYTSSIMRYVDDAEFLLDSKQNIINVRSASRLGYRDFDVNRDRIEAIRQALKINDTE